MVHQPPLRSVWPYFVFFFIYFFFPPNNQTETAMVQLWSIPMHPVISSHGAETSTSLSVIQISCQQMMLLVVATTTSNFQPLVYHDGNENLYQRKKTLLKLYWRVVLVMLFWLVERIFYAVLFSVSSWSSATLHSNLETHHVMFPGK